MPPAAPQCTPEKDPRPHHGPQNLLHPAVPSAWKAVSPLGPGHPAHLSLQPLGVDLDGSMGWGCSKPRPGGSKGDGRPALGASALLWHPCPAAASVSLAGCEGRSLREGVRSEGLLGSFLLSSPSTQRLLTTGTWPFGRAQGQAQGQSPKQILPACVKVRAEPGGGMGPCVSPLNCLETQPFGGLQWGNIVQRGQGSCQGHTAQWPRTLLWEGRGRPWSFSSLCSPEFLGQPLPPPPQGS